MGTLSTPSSSEDFNQGFPTPPDIRFSTCRTVEPYSLHFQQFPVMTLLQRIPPE